jgi:hypothetical protein
MVVKMVVRPIAKLIKGMLKSKLRIASASPGATKETSVLSVIMTSFRAPGAGQ